ncbi:MAG: hypothetical protein JWM99_3997 [Verrucomicrobiales bacterium]|nr:hypothetical protein [Verrucomicrobiales bacterium]
MSSVQKFRGDNIYREPAREWEVGVPIPCRVDLIDIQPAFLKLFAQKERLLCQ